MVAGLNIKAIVFYIVLVAVILIALLYFVAPRFGVTAVQTAINGAVSNLKLPELKLPSLQEIGAWIQQNTVVVGVMASLGTTAAGYFIKNWQTNKLLDQKITELNTEKIKSLGLETAAIDLQKKLEVWESDTTASDLQNSLSSMKTDFEKTLIGKDAEIKALNTSINQLHEQLANRPVQIVETVK